MFLILQNYEIKINLGMKFIMEHTKFYQERHPQDSAKSLGH